MHRKTTNQINPVPGLEVVGGFGETRSRWCFLQAGPAGRLDSFSDGATRSKPSHPRYVQLLFTVVFAEAKPASGPGYALTI